MKNQCFVTAIGSSAGGTKALTAFFQSLDTEIDTAYVILLHLAKDQKGFIAETLKGITELPVTEVREKTRIESKHVYVIPPQYYLRTEKNELLLSERENSSVNTALDIFFTSLATSHKEKAIGVIMSGMGTDGSKGIRHIKANGGIVFVQKPESATYTSMPMSAILVDHPDFIGTEKELAEMLSTYLQTPGLSGEKESEQRNVDILQKILNQLSGFSSVNFSDYKKNTLLRRIDKRVKINHLHDLSEYLDFIENDPDELKVLFNDLLIGVTEFFRDEKAFQALEKNIIPAIFKHKKGAASLRLWVPGCSTGEEAYSIAMLVEEFIQSTGSPVEFKLFATDLNSKAISVAGRGQYPAQIKDSVPDNLLNKYFIRKGDTYEIIKDLRKKIIFSVHNLLSDPPFIRLDLISCRNVFIYLKEDAQRKLLYTFNYSLQENGFLMLGVNENDGHLTDIFEQVDIKSKIYKSKMSHSRFRPEYSGSFDFTNYSWRDNPSPDVAVKVKNTEDDGYADVLLDTYAPDCLVISDKDTVVYTMGNVDQYITFPNRRSNLNIFAMVKGNALLAMRNGVNKAREIHTDVVIKNVVGFQPDPETHVDLHFYPKTNRQTLEECVIVEFNNPGKIGKKKELLEVPPRDLVKEVERLETELYRTRRELQYNSDELEAINEELQSSNEEMKSSNEEMQTTNEELQSTNEELKTVNQELQNKIDEITILHDDVNNLFVSTEIATLFLDKDLKIRKYTPSLQAYFNIRTGDIGRPIHHYTFNFDYPELISDLRKVMLKLSAAQKELKVGDGYAQIKIIPYKTDDMRIEGVILTFTDITDLKKANLSLNELTESLKKRTEELKQSEEYWRSFLQNTPDVVARLDLNGNIRYVNDSVEDILTISPQNTIGKKAHYVFGSDSKSRKMISEQVKKITGRVKSLNFNLTFSENDINRELYCTLLPELNAGSNSLRSVLLVIRDVTELKRAEDKMRINQRRLEDLNQYMDSFVHAVAHDLRSPVTNLKLIEELMNEEINEENKSKLIGKIGDSVNKIDDILSGLIEIVDREIGISQNVERINIKKVAERALHQIPEEVSNGLSIDFDLKIEDITYIEAFLSSIFRNVLSNAIKYKSEKRPLEIQISSRKSGRYILISVTDNGIGMDIKKVKEFLFKPFKRFSTKAEGKGIGLHIIKSMIQKSGGKIEVESEKGKGSTFHIYLLPLPEVAE